MMQLSKIDNSRRQCINDRRAITGESNNILISVSSTYSAY